MKDFERGAEAMRQAILGLVPNNPDAAWAQAKAAVEAISIPNVNGMNTQEQCEAIIKKIVELANQGKEVMFTEDWGANSLTIHIGGAHTHVGGIEHANEATIAERGSASTFEQLAEELYNTLHGGPGLTWYDPEGDLPDKL